MSEIEMLRQLTAFEQKEALLVSTRFHIDFLCVLR